MNRHIDWLHGIKPPEKAFLYVMNPSPVSLIQPNKKENKNDSHAWSIVNTNHNNAWKCNQAQAWTISKWDRNETATLGRSSMKIFYAI